jgi:hypothetical protein
VCPNVARLKRSPQQRLACQDSLTRLERVSAVSTAACCSMLDTPWKGFMPPADVIQHSLCTPYKPLCHGLCVGSMGTSTSVTHVTGWQSTDSYR